MFKQYFKKFFLLSLFVFGIILPLSLKAEEPEYFEFIIEEEVTKELHGVQYRKMVGQFRLGDRIVKQSINYTAANILENDNLFAVSTDDYIPHGYGMSNMRGQVFVTNQKFKNQAEVVSAVNGDFFIIQSEDSNQLGLSIGAHISEYRTIYEGGAGRPLIGIHDDGRVTIGVPQYGGYEVLVFDDAGSKKLKEIKVSGFNRLPEEGETTAYFWDHQDVISSPEPKMVFKGTNVKTITGSAGKYFAEGNLSYVTTEDVTLERGDFLLMGEDIFSDGLITKNDTVVVQNMLTGIHEGIRSGVAGGQMLVMDGEIVHSDNKEVHPRTAVGVKADGTLFFVTIDGRMPLNSLPGMDYEQMSYLMIYLGAEVAVNVDGGGSTTMLFYNEETNYYDTMNTPSDNPHSLRSVANGLAFMYGNLELPLPPSPYPDTRDILSNPNQLYFDLNDHTLSFKDIDDALYYNIVVNGAQKFVTNDNYYQFDLDYGTYTFGVQAFGDFDYYKQSEMIEYEVNVFTNGMLSLIEGLKGYGKNANSR